MGCVCACAPAQSCAARVHVQIYAHRRPNTTSDPFLLHRFRQEARGQLLSCPLKIWLARAVLYMCMALGPRGEQTPPKDSVDGRTPKHDPLGGRQPGTQSTRDPTTFHLVIGRTLGPRPSFSVKKVSCCGVHQCYSVTASAAEAIMAIRPIVCLSSLQSRNELSLPHLSGAPGVNSCPCCIHMLLPAPRYSVGKKTVSMLLSKLAQCIGHLPANEAVYVLHACCVSACLLCAWCMLVACMYLRSRQLVSKRF